MQLTPNLIDRLGNVHRRYGRLREKFTAFVDSLEWFLQPNCQVPGVTVLKADDGLSCTVSLATTTLRFAFAIGMPPEGGTVIGVVACTLVAPAFTGSPPVIGSFTFDGRGVANIELQHGADLPEVDWLGPEITLHFMNLALARPVH